MHTKHSTLKCWSPEWHRLRAAVIMIDDISVPEGISGSCQCAHTPWPFQQESSLASLPQRIKTYCAVTIALTQWTERQFLNRKLSVLLNMYMFQSVKHFQTCYTCFQLMSKVIYRFWSLRLLFHIQTNHNATSEYNKLNSVCFMCYRD